MPAAAVAVLVVTAVLVAALAFYLIWIAVIVRGLVDTLGKVTFGVGAIAHRLEPVGPVLDEVNQDLMQVAEAIEGLVADVEDRPGQAAS